MTWISCSGTSGIKGIIFWVIYTKNFENFLPSISQFHLVLLTHFWNFRLHGSYFGNSLIFGISGNFPRIFPLHLFRFKKFGNFWLNGKRPGDFELKYQQNSHSLITINKVNKSLSLGKLWRIVVHIFQFSHMHRKWRVTLRAEVPSNFLERSSSWPP